jgi:amidohydrolase
MASSDTLRVTVVGRGGHGCAPHRAADPIQAMCAMVTTLQTFVTRELDVFDPAVITVGRIQGGTAGNIIPETASFEATVRSFSIASRDRLQSRLPALCQDIARAHGVRAEALFDPGYPATTNDERETVRAMATAAELLGDEAVQTLPAPLTGSEDFSRVLNEVPGAMLLLGATAPGQDPMTAPPNHSPQAHFEESVLVPGATLYSELALGRLAVSE